MHVDAKFVHRCFHAAETQDNQSTRTTDSEDENELQARLVERIAENVAFDDDVDDAGHLFEYLTVAATATLNLLLPESQPTAALDCSNFMDFDEFNLCLNNMFSDEFIAEAGLDVALEQQQHQQQQGCNQVSDETLSNDDDLDLHFLPNEENFLNDDATNTTSNTTTTTKTTTTPSIEQQQAEESSPMQAFFTPTITGGFVGSDTEGECSSDSNTLSFGSSGHPTTTTAAAARTTIAANTNAVDVIKCNNHVVNIFQ